MASKRELVLAALHARLLTLAATVLREGVLPERIPATGLIILRDGKPGEAEVTLSPLSYYYEHRAELEVVIQADSGRDALRVPRQIEPLAQLDLRHQNENHRGDEAPSGPVTPDFSARPHGLAFAVDPPLGYKQDRLAGA